MKGKGKTFRFYGADRVMYPFYAVDERTAISYARAWSRKRGIKLYRRIERKAAG